MKSMKAKRKPKRSEVYLKKRTKNRYQTLPREVNWADEISYRKERKRKDGEGATKKLGMKNAAHKR